MLVVDGRPASDKAAEFWTRFTAYPVALIECDGYYESLRPKSRAMIRQADRRYTFGRFVRNDELPALDVINHSRPATSEGPMRGWQSRSIRPEGEQQGFAWYGGWDADGVLRGYCRLWSTGRIALLHDFLAHAEASTGVLNGLLAHMAAAAGVDYLVYGRMGDGSPGRRAFKERAGFRACELAVRC